MYGFHNNNKRMVNVLIIAEIFAFL
jgi:hypothetical protein